MKGSSCRINSNCYIRIQQILPSASSNSFTFGPNPTQERSNASLIACNSSSPSEGLNNLIFIFIFLFGTLMTRIGRIFTDLICVNPLDMFYPCSKKCFNVIFFESFSDRIGFVTGHLMSISGSFQIILLSCMGE